MTTTAHEDQYTVAPEPVRHPYDTVSILKRNVADLELELKRQTERATHKGATHCDDCGLTWLDDGLNPLRCPYCKDPVPAPAVPFVTDESTIERACDAVAEALGDAYDCTRVWSAWSYGTMGPDDFSLVTDSSERIREIAEAAISALLQSAEVQAGDKWQLTPAPTHPADRNAGEVRHD